MSAVAYKTKFIKSTEINKDWFVADANARTLGRFASKVASVIRGKHKSLYTPNADCGDHVIVINADKIRMTGKKWTQKNYVSYSGYPGGQKHLTPRDMMRKSKTKVVEMAIRGMLPKTRLGRQMFRSLHVYEGTNHPYAAQNPKVLEFK